jgi:hypothetical protein
VPVGKIVHVVLDNHATYKRPKVRAWLQRHPRFVFHSIIDLQVAIKQFLNETNDNSQPFMWTVAPTKSSLPSGVGTECRIRSAMMVGAAQARLCPTYEFRSKSALTCANTLRNISGVSTRVFVL